MPHTKNEKQLLGEALSELVSSIRNGASFDKIRIGLMATGSELGQEELLAGALSAMEQDPRLQVIPIGPVNPNYPSLEWIATEDCDADVAAAMEKGLADGSLAAAVALHYPFPMGVTTIGRVITPAKGRPLFIASTTGSSASDRVEAMVRNAIYGIAAAKACGIAKPQVGILNVDGAQTVFRILSKLAEKGYPISFAQSKRSDGGAILRGNDALMGSADVCVTDTLTGNIMMKFFSAWSSGGSYEACGWGYGPSTGEGWKRVISIISRASGSPVVAGALTYTAQAVRGNLPDLCAAEIKAAKQAGLDALLEEYQARTTTSAPAVSAPPAEPTGEEIHGIDVLAIEDATRALWGKGIYAESAMGCTGPVVKVPAHRLHEAEAVLKEQGYL
ncbi:MAG: glycine reductase [Synergistaceae bacterium]|nr:glycine reductase [Synergistaceae bacterium]MBP9956952.1 glycine reductase [Synergistaceae bacterium]